VSTWRRYQYTPPADRGGPGWELIVQGKRPPGPYTPPVELNGTGVSRWAAAWLLGRARRDRARGGRLWVTRYGPRQVPQRVKED
jgi:hypothetical protein